MYLPSVASASAATRPTIKSTFISFASNSSNFQNITIRRTREKSWVPAVKPSTYMPTSDYG